MDQLKIAIAAFFAACALAAPARAQERIQVPAGEAYTHAPSGMVFPASVGAFQRISVVRYGQGNDNFSAGYNLDADGQLRIAATVYVQLSPNIVSVGSPQETIDTARALLCQQQFAGVQREIEAVYRDARRLEGALPAPSSPLQPSGAYTFEVANFGGPHTIVQSEAHLRCYLGGRWTVKYRITYPASYDARAAIDAFMRDLAITIAPEANAP